MLWASIFAFSTSASLCLPTWNLIIVSWTSCRIFSSSRLPMYTFINYSILYTCNRVFGTAQGKRSRDLKLAFFCARRSFISRHISSSKDCSCSTIDISATATSCTPDPSSTVTGSEFTKAARGRCAGGRVSGGGGELWESGGGDGEVSSSTERTSSFLRVLGRVFFVRTGVVGTEWRLLGSEWGGERGRRGVESCCSDSRLVLSAR